MLCPGALSISVTLARWVFDAYGRCYHYVYAGCMGAMLVTVDLLYVTTGFLRTEGLLTS